MDIRNFFVKKPEIEKISLLLQSLKLKSVNVNKGTGAGGAKTNLNGKTFEDLTSNEMRLESQGFVKTLINKSKYGYYFSKKNEEREIIFAQQHGFVLFIKNKFGITLVRHPDEAYIIIPKEGKVIVKILEKKNQNVEGSVQDKLWTGPTFKDEYLDFLGNQFEVNYAYCLSNWFKNKFETEPKYKNLLKNIWPRNGIVHFYGEDPDYYEKLDLWIN